MSKLNSHNRPTEDPSIFLAAYIPSMTTTVQNLLVSLGTLLSAIISLWVTFAIFLPLSCVKAITPNIFWTRLTRKDTAIHHMQSETSEQSKTILILDGSQGLGFGLVAKYVTEPNATVIAATNDIETLRNAILDPSAPQADNAIVQCTSLDLAGPRKTIVETLKKIDKEYGPINHLYVVPPAGGQVRSTENASVKQNGIILNGTNGFASKEGHSGRQIVQTTDDFINTHIIGVVTCVLAMYELMKGRGYGNITVAVPVSGAYQWSWPSLFTIAGDHHNILNQITGLSTSVFLRTFASSLHFMALQRGVEVTCVAFDLSPTDANLVYMESLGKNEKEAYLNKLTKEVAVKVASRSHLHSPTSVYYHDHECHCSLH
ncbi:hypothetical protein CPB83DRAFT_855495 [Crepidotus variabilis]|uniref:Uncharacterized protein n=1 Tax=Crepidotus variabilis TaxID=179855 RepID=A0A9P6EFE0_9AGAR|nr:hypothetical protein CPB83DRAFT_855495 [Crepidotus variabilis]